MTELEMFTELKQAIEVLITILGVHVGLLLTIIFAMAWGRNTHV